MPEESRKARRDLFKFYYPKEKDVTIPPMEKIKLVETWYQLANDITKKDKISRSMLKRVLETSNIGFRHKARDFLKLCRDNEVNLSVVSGGCSGKISFELYPYSQ